MANRDHKFFLRHAIPILPAIIVSLISGCNSIYQKNVSGEYSDVTARSASLLQLSENKDGRIDGRITVIQFNTSGTANKSVFYATGYDEDNKITITFTQNNPAESSFTLSGTMKGNKMFLNGINNNGLLTNTILTKNNITVYQNGVKAIFEKENLIKISNSIEAAERKQDKKITEIERNANNSSKYEQHMINRFINIVSQSNIDRYKATYAAMLNRVNQLYSFEKRYSEIKNLQAHDKVIQLNVDIIFLIDHLDNVNRNRNNRIKTFYNLENEVNNIYIKTGCLMLTNLEKMRFSEENHQYSITRNACMNAYMLHQKIMSIETHDNNVISHLLPYQNNISSKIKETAAKANALANQ